MPGLIYELASPSVLTEPPAVVVSKPLDDRGPGLVLGRNDLLNDGVRGLQERTNIAEQFVGLEAGRM
ncbi:MAG: hypothetical protein V3U67_09700 [Gemmatimonadota bacterium]